MAVVEVLEEVIILLVNNGSFFLSFFCFDAYLLFCFVLLARTSATALTAVGKAGLPVSFPMRRLQGVTLSITDAVCHVGDGSLLVVLKS